MKNLQFLLAFVLLFGCSSADLINNWKNPDIEVYTPNKVLIIGLTSNDNARKKFENELKSEYERRGITAVASYEYFNSEKKTEQDIDKMEQQIINDGFDTILFTKVIGSDSKTRLAQFYKNIEGTYRDFKEEYYSYQDIIHNAEYYENYQIYHAETELFCVCETEAKKLIWKGYVDITDPISIEDTVSDYVNLLVLAKDEQNLMQIVD
jgi:hypothetical protein